VIFSLSPFVLLFVLFGRIGGMENNLHWVLDYAFDEDSQRTRMGNSAANMSIIQHISLNLLKSESTAKVGVKNKRLKAGWDNQYLLTVLFSMNRKVA